MNKIKYLIIPAVILTLVASLVLAAALAPAGAWAKKGSGNENPGDPPGWGSHKLVGEGPGNSGGSPGHTQENPGQGGSDPPGPRLAKNGGGGQTGTKPGTNWPGQPPGPFTA